jgi:hypothetical protein
VVDEVEEEVEEEVEAGVRLWAPEVEDAEGAIGLLPEP